MGGYLHIERHKDGDIKMHRATNAKPKDFKKPQLNLAVSSAQEGEMVNLPYQIDLKMPNGRVMKFQLRR